MGWSLTNISYHLQGRSGKYPPGQVVPPLVSILFNVRCRIPPLTVAGPIITNYIQISRTNLRSLWSVDQASSGRTQ